MKANEIIDIFNRSGFSVVKDEIFGNVVEMSPEDCFMFSATTGAKYLFYENGITMKGRNEVFIHRSIFSNGHLIYTPGLFSRTIDGFISEGNSADNLLRKYPFVFNGNKRVVICDTDTGKPSNIEKDIYKKICERGGSPANYVLYKNYLSNNIGESLQEYFASVYFIRNGYLVENQVPWFQQNYHFDNMILQGGIPDFSAFHGKISGLLRKYNFISSVGLSLCVLPVIKLFRRDLFKERATEKKYSYELLIGEAKTNISALPQALKQLEKYAAVKLARGYFTIIPNSAKNSKFGSFYIDANHDLVYSGNEAAIFSNARTEEDDRWLSTYIKMLLLGNVAFGKIIHFISDYRANRGLDVSENYRSTHLLDAVQNTDDNSFFEFLKEAM
ncbi:MAG: hypothetical protein NC184_07660 [Roseburia sp.]|nr:hypothetical protein [Roseburia sp.]